MKIFTDRQKDPAEEFLFFHSKWLSVSCPAVINKVLKAKEWAWVYKTWSKVELNGVYVVQQVLSKHSVSGHVLNAP